MCVDCTIRGLVDNVGKSRAILWGEDGVTILRGDHLFESLYVLFLCCHRVGIVLFTNLLYACYTLYFVKFVECLERRQRVYV